MLTDVMTSFKTVFLLLILANSVVLTSQKEGIVFYSYTNSMEVLKLCHGI